MPRALQRLIEDRASLRSELSAIDERMQALLRSGRVSLNEEIYNQLNEFVIDLLLELLVHDVLVTISWNNEVIYAVETHIIAGGKE